jgi:hypothetical protein
MVPEVDFYSLHGIWGAYSSLALGRLGRGAGPVIGGVRPPGSGLFAGYGFAGGLPRLLPFCPDCVGSEKGGSSREPERPSDAGKNPCAWFNAGEIERSISLSGEEWSAGDMRFSVTSFFGRVPDPEGLSVEEARAAMNPSILIRLRFDNSRGGEEMLGLFGLQGLSRPLSDSGIPGLVGMASGDSFGFACEARNDVAEVMDESVVEAAFGPERPMRRSAAEGGLRFRIAPGRSEEFIVALGCLRDGIVTAGVPMRAWHALLFAGLEEVLIGALKRAPGMLAKAAALDARLEASVADQDRRFLISQAAHSYCANTELLADEAGKPVFIVNEGEYRKMNALGLTVDQAFWELEFSPWTLRNELESLLSRSRYSDAMGIAFARDQGAADRFAPVGRSSNEMSGPRGGFSSLSCEETLDWTLSACLYAWSGDDPSWLPSREEALAACLRSLKARDLGGTMEADRPRGKLYLAVKAWAAFVCLEAVFSGLRGPSSDDADASREAAVLISGAVTESMLEEEGYIPADFGNGDPSRIIQAIEGLAYPPFCGAAKALSADGPYAGLMAALKRHLDTVLAPGVCLDPVSGGWRLSSTDPDTRMSKIFLNQFVAERILGFEGDERVRRDAVHASWLRNGSAEFAATDQVDSSSGRDLGSRLYPRLVTSVLWMADLL